jgi:23S rRNA pseudouridine2457 synthase
MPKDTTNYRYFAIYKPFGMLSSFTPEQAGQATLADIVPRFPGDVYPVGRLDKDSEGLLLLTNDPSVNSRLLNPAQHHRRMYWVQVEGVPDSQAIARLTEGLDIRIDKKLYLTLPARVQPGIDPGGIPEREPPIRFRASIPNTWLSLSIREGKNRQVRRMCAAVGFPVLRLIRVQIEGLSLSALQPGRVEEWEKTDFFNKLNL